jgi:hypothetical protein
MTTEVKTPAQIAQETANAAAQTAAIAADAAELATLDSITHVKDFSAKTNSKFQADKLKSAYIRRKGFEAFQELCGQSR